MKKILKCITIGIMILSFSGCNSVSNINRNVENTPVPSAESGKENTNLSQEKTSENENKSSKNEKKEIIDGETIITESKEITINKVEFTYDIMPDNTSSYYRHIPAKEGSVYIVVYADVKNNSKQDIDEKKIGTVKADYNNGYEYTGIIAGEESGGTRFNSFFDITPLSTQGIIWMIECPDEITQNTNPLVLNFKIDGEDFIYTIR